MLIGLLNQHVVTFIPSGRNKPSMIPSVFVELYEICLARAKERFGLLDGGGGDTDSIHSNLGEWLGLGTLTLKLWFGLLEKYLFCTTTKVTAKNCWPFLFLAAESGVANLRHPLVTVTVVVVLDKPPPPPSKHSAAWMGPVD